MRLELLQDYDETAHARARPIYEISDKGLDGRDDLPAPLRALARANGFSGEAGVVLAHEEGVLLGVGDGSDPFILAAAAEKLPEGDYRLAPTPASDLAWRAGFAWLLGSYRFDRYRKQKPAAARLIAPRGLDVAAVRREVGAVGYIRDLVNTPAADMTPSALEAEARALAKAHGAKIETIIGEALLERNFPLIHAVGRAAAEAPRLVDLVWGREDAPRITLIGKGVCFDSGGLDLKSASNMLLMKKDMGGAAHALGLARMIMESGLDVRLRVLIPAVENAVSGSAYRPGDILNSRKGLTVEIGNTDAEGRLVLADALALAGEEEDPPALLVTLATLTGAARVALGPELAPYYANDEALAAELMEAGRAVADPLWRMPLWPGYDSMLASTVADVSNVGNGSFAGSITAALFLKRFAPAGVPWAHFDIYAWRPKAAPGRPVGGEAQAVRALLRVIADRTGGNAEGA
ncbi:leucyl aminopeptidase family protein [Amphiplicatus metriothermophilus]|uniref:Leucyl aminopeptidase n=1 Tax=Amphiplicatus metriothermophilus TaxID=1519374 RepID=A0A239PJ02_9PROT|nr:leucyl aminopeptidase family protein [Amphiplicatus metriothermophilus]MBB5517910.1 leucyl aminopeptidase [Amphiplicatus metriothermophilus]SNT67756.1 leucyl aminopeptidase [Amphiplicatus metriothermophilus]